MALDFLASFSAEGEATWKLRPFTTPSPVVSTRAFVLRSTCEVYGSQMARHRPRPG